MRNSLLRFVFVSALVACRGSDASSKTASTQTNPADTARTAAGALAPSAPDTISDRADRGRIMGDSTATVWLIMASDFQCPYCKQWHDAQFNTIMQEYAAKNKIRMAFLNFPLSIHPNALPASEAAMCAAIQKKFWPVHEALFATQTRWEGLKDPTPVFDSLVTAAGVNMASYKQCVSKHLTAPLIEADRERAKQAGVGSTPTFFVGSKVLAGADQNIRAALDSAIAQARGAKKPKS